MPYNYESIAHQWFEELKTPFANYIRSRYDMSYDEVMDLYTEVWLEVRQIIRSGRATGNKWKALIFTIGRRKATRICQYRVIQVPLNEGGDDGDDDSTFNRRMFEADKEAQRLAACDVWEDPNLQAVLGAELSYIPDPCNKILKLFYYEELSMKEIARAMNYRNPDTAKATKSRCMDKLKARVKEAVYRMGLID